ncbi:MAG: ATP-binding protein, partial [Anaerolineaceae bacterium]|nr:ATP-binding protein [Anaerolineaceae bacterium]
NEKDFIDLKGLPPEDINAYLASDKQVFDTGTVFIQPESPIIRPGKPVLWFETIKIPLETNGIVDKVLVVRADVTDRKNTLEALKAERANLTQRVEERTAELVRLNIELQESSRAKDEFLANMSHELRTPLNAILGMSEILQEQLFGDLNEKQLKQVNVIEESGRHLLTLINDILDLAKIVSGQRELAYQPVNITDLCKSSLNFINSQAIKKNITVSFEPLNELTEIEADPRSVKQILINLLSNAVKFTPENGHIGLRVEQDSQNELVCFTVWDTGIGITLEQSLKLFMPFVQVDSSLARKYAGTGLGLSLISRLVDMHGGSVQLKSGGVHGKGSQFTIHLPLHPTRIQTSLQPEFEDEPILLIDDEPNSRIRMQTILAKLGCRVRTAKIDDETIRIAHEIKPKLIFIDLQTPQETSLQTIHQMRQELGEQSIPVLCMTSLLNQKNPDLAESFGTYEYLLKPVSPKLVRLLLNKYLREY